jgi:hypothetical protein
MDTNMKQYILLFFSLFALVACVDREFDIPPIPEPVELETNATLEDLKGYFVPGNFVTIPEDLTIGAIVAADDRSGNYFRAIVVQDETGGIELRINATGLYNDFPVGSKIFIKAKGLIISDFNGLIQLGGYTDIGSDGRPRLIGIEPALLSDYIVKGKRDGGLSPKARKITELTNADITTLIALEEVQFVETSLGQTFADMVNNRSRNLNIEDCEGNSIIVRTSNFATFGGQVVPSGKGTLVAIYSVFGADKQLIIRELSDLKLSGTRCDGSDPGGGGEKANISEIRSLYQGSSLTLPSAKFIQGIVISDRAAENITSRNLVIQQPGDKGLVVRFDVTHAFNLNDEITIDLSGLELNEFNGLLQVNNVPLNRAKKVGIGSIVPSLLTLAEIKSDFENLESTLVRVKESTLSKTSGNTFSLNATITDPTGSMDFFTTSYASFANSPLPTGELTITAIVSQGGSEAAQQLSIRNLADIEGGSGGENPVQISIENLRAVYQGQATTAPAARFIEGIVISDRANSNITNRNLVIQELGGKGIVVRFAEVHSFNLNQVLRIDVSNMEISEFNGLLQVNNVPLGNATAQGTGSIAPRVFTIQEIQNDFENWESTLVRILDANLSKTSGNTFSGTVLVRDSTGDLDMFTTSYSSFANQTFPTGTVQITGILGQGGTAQARQISIRNPNLDIQTP